MKITVKLVPAKDGKLSVEIGTHVLWIGEIPHKIIVGVEQ